MGINSELNDVYSNIFPLEIKQGKIYGKPYDGAPISKNTSLIRYKDKLISPDEIEGCEALSSNVGIDCALVNRELRRKMTQQGYVFKGKAKCYNPQDEIEHQNSSFFKLYQGFVYHTPIIQDRVCLCINYSVILECCVNVAYFINNGVSPNSFEGINVTYLADDGKYYRGFLKQIGNGVALIKAFYSDEKKILTTNIFPERGETIDFYLQKINLPGNATTLVKEKSLLDSKTASKDRLETILKLVQQLKERVFPLSFGEFEVNINGEPIGIRSP